MARAPANKQQVAAKPVPPTVVVSGDGDRLALAGTLDRVTLAEARTA